MKTKHATDTELLLKALAHWQENWDRFQNGTLTFDDITSIFCPLCQVYLEYQPTNPCRGCPIYEKASKTHRDSFAEHCRASPWIFVRQHLGRLTTPGLSDEAKHQHHKMLEHAILAEYKYIANLWLSHIEDQ